MMREILFRGKSINTGGWLYGDLTDTSDSERAQIWVRNEYGGRDNYLVDARTVGQFTGLTDKNGKKIFEGDIVQKWVHRYREKGFEPTGDRLLRGDVYWTENEGGFSGIWAIHSRDEEGKPVSYGFTSDFEVVGNIHDNPELLEEKDHETD